MEQTDDLIHDLLNKADETTTGEIAELLRRAAVALAATKQLYSALGSLNIDILHDAAEVLAEAGFDQKAGTISEAACLLEDAQTEQHGATP